MLERIVKDHFVKRYWAAAVVKGRLKMCPLERREKLRPHFLDMKATLETSRKANIQQL